MDKIDKNGNKVHPNSLKNLVSSWDSESAKEAQKLGAAKKKANKIAREQLSMSMADWKEYKPVLDENNMSAVDVLKVLMHKSLQDGDYDTAADLAKSIAEFEQPKLARIESKIEEVNADELTDEELEAKLREFATKAD